jgi:hypothetical protein
VEDPAESASNLAARLHAGQKDKGGRPYHDHLAAVVEILLRRWPHAPAWAVEAAWLHDALEDTAATPRDLLTMGVSPEAVALVQMVTRPRGTTYRGWIAWLGESGNLWAIRLKLADNEHNSDPSRRLPRSDIVERRYLPARAVLEQALADAERLVQSVAGDAPAHP